MLPFATTHDLSRLRSALAAVATCVVTACGMTPPAPLDATLTDATAGDALWRPDLGETAVLPDTAAPDAAPDAPPAVTPPALAREMRAVWVATVFNTDWPSRAGLSAAQQRTELTAMLDRFAALGFNTVVLQVRAAGDALYPSTLEPFSRALTGRQGGDPGYDPLAFAVTEAHARGLELHAWFNPFRAATSTDTSLLAPEHLARRRPDLVRTYNNTLWFDPGEPDVHDAVMAVIADVVRRYDVDAVHLDDYFYPYPVSPPVAFPDDATYMRYVAGAGATPLSRADWRRDNVNRFVQRLYREVHALEPWVRVGISPFGIWRPNNPPGIVGLDAYNDIYADTRRWLQSGWVDYFVPQLYWPIDRAAQSYTALLDWWVAQNAERRNVYAGNAAYRINDGTSSAVPGAEILAQVAATRMRAPGAGGNFFYNATAVMRDRDGFATRLAEGLYQGFALPPASSWLDRDAPPAPTITVESVDTPRGWRVRPQPASGSEAVAWWLVRARAGGAWTARVWPGDRAELIAPAVAMGMLADALVVHAVDRVGNLSDPVVWRAP